MNIKINRGKELFEIETFLEGDTLLHILEEFPEIALSSSCRSSVCGSCGVVVNDKEVLACEYHPKEGDEVHPMRNMEIVRDLVVKNRKWEESLHLLPTASDNSTCISCSLCYSACPVFEANPNFANPVILTRIASRFENLSEKQKAETVGNLQKNGVWDCTLCGLCTEVCPQNIDPKNDILSLRTSSVQFGYSDPNFTNMNFDFGF
jgi:fumarate reductase iron-sulfur subunit